jgi:cytochrome c-type biogenesis protein CcmH/NrfG
MIDRMTMTDLKEKCRLHLGPVLLLVIATVAVYARILGHDFLYVWDDNFYVTQNPSAWGFSLQNIKGAFSNFYTGNYAPVQILSYMLDYTFWGLNPAGYLFSNIIIHLLNGLLIYHLLLRLYGGRMLPFIAAALFLLHPLQVETVAWVSQRKSLLAIFFMLIAWEAYCKYRETSSAKRWLPYAVSVLAFILSLLAKSVTVVFPIMLLLFDIAFPNRESRQRYKDKIPYIIAMLAATVVTLIAQNPEVGSGGRTGFHGGTLWATFMTMLTVFCRYLGMILWPGNLSADYAPVVHTSPDFAVCGSFLILVAVMLFGFTLWQKERCSGFWFLFFWFGLLPVSQIVPIVTLMNDRYLYLPMLGAATLAGIGAAFLASLNDGKYSLLVKMGAVFVLGTLAIVSFNRAAVWRDSITLFRDQTAKYPDSVRGWRFLAEAYLGAGRVSEARQTYYRALVLKEDNQTALAGLAGLLNDLGELEESYSYLQKLLRINPEHAVGWGILGDNLLKRGEYAEAEKAYRRALTIQPSALPVYLKLGEIAIKQKRYDEARSNFDTLERKSPNNPEVAFRRAGLEALTGNTDVALIWLEKSLQRGYRDYDSISSNREISSLWNNPRFVMLLGSYFPEEEGQTGGVK